MNNAIRDTEMTRVSFAQYATSGIIQYKIDTVKEAISNNEVSGSRVKGLTISLLDASKQTASKGTSELLGIAKCISAWEENKDFKELKKSILSSYASREDICSIYLCKENQSTRFIVVMEDATSDTVFEYNEIGFLLSEKHNEIEDFMVIDNEEAEGCLELLSNYNLIYIRG